MPSPDSAGAGQPTDAVPNDVAIELTPSNESMERLLIGNLDEARQQFPADDRRLLEPMQRLADWYAGQRRIADAEPLHEELLRLRTLSYGAEDPRLFTTLKQLAALAIAAGNWARAEAWLTAACVTQSHVEPPPGEVLGTLWNHLAEVCFEQAKYREATAHGERALALLREDAELPFTHPLVLRTLNNLGALHAARGEYHMAERLFRQNLRLSTPSVGKKDPALVRPLSNLAEVLRMQGRFAESEKYTREALNLCTRAFGLCHPLVAQALCNLALLKIEARRLPSAERHYRQALAIHRQIHPHGHPHLARTLRGIAELHLANRNLREADTALREALALDVKLLGPGHPQIAVTLRLLGQMYQSAGQFEHARQMWTRTLKLQQSKRVAADPQIATTLNLLAGLAAAQGDFERAHHWHLQALAIQEQSLGMQHLEVARTLLGLAEVELSRHEAAAAEVALKRALQIRESRLGSEHADVVEIRRRLQRAFGGTQPPTPVNTTETLAIDELHGWHALPDAEPRMAAPDVVAAEVTLLAEAAVSLENSLFQPVASKSKRRQKKQRKKPSSKVAS